MKNLLDVIARENRIEKKVSDKTEKSRKQEEKKHSPLGVVESRHSVIIEGNLVRYTARTGMMKLVDENGKEKAHIFFTGYEKDVPSNERLTRPITFAFNGGPGASSVWVHFGAMGPKRVEMTDDGRPLPPPYRFTENPHSWLDITDLVFIDPVGTGYSNYADDADPKEFWGVKEDIETVGEFIRLYVTKHNRWLSPKFVAGESYGTVRAAGLAGHLQTKLGMDVNGIILISSCIDSGTLEFTPTNDLPNALFVPTYTATAWYHKKLSPRLQEDLGKTLEEVESWVIREYIPALAHGNALSPERYARTREKLSEYTGLSEKYLDYTCLRVNEFRFMKELLRDSYRTVGRLDSRALGIDADSAGEFTEYDASFSNGPFVSTVNDYLRKELKYENDRAYNFINMDLGEKWNWSSVNKIGYVSTADILRGAIHQNKYLRVLVMNGFFDLATPYFATKYTINQMRLDPTLRNNIEMTYYEAGHMVYYPREMLRKFKKDSASFIEKNARPEYRKD